MFAGWPTVLPGDIEIIGIQYPGRGTRLSEPAYTQLEPLVRSAAAGLAPYLDKPFAFFGHSMGALVAWDLARHLRRSQGTAPERIMVSGNSAPQVPDRHPPTYDLPEPQFIQKLRELGGMPEEVLQHRELLELIVPILRADFTLCETYRYEPDRPLDCPLSAFGGLEDPYVSREDLEAWREQTTGSFSVRMFPGDHFFLNTARPLLLGAIARELANTLSGGVVH